MILLDYGIQHHLGYILTLKHLQKVSTALQLDMATLSPKRLDDTDARYNNPRSLVEDSLNLFPV
jgi:hypothetical protein